MEPDSTTMFTPGTSPWDEYETGGPGGGGWRLPMGGGGAMRHVVIDVLNIMHFRRLLSRPLHTPKAMMYEQVPTHIVTLASPDESKQHPLHRVHGAGRQGLRPLSGRLPPHLSLRQKSSGDGEMGGKASRLSALPDTWVEGTGWPQDMLLSYECACLQRVSRARAHKRSMNATTLVRRSSKCSRSPEFLLG